MSVYKKEEESNKKIILYLPINPHNIVRHNIASFLLLPFMQKNKLILWHQINKKRGWNYIRLGRVIAINKKKTTIVQYTQDNCFSPIRNTCWIEQNTNYVPIVEIDNNIIIAYNIELTTNNILPEDAIIILGKYFKDINYIWSDKQPMYINPKPRN
jgi:hypothetical protein